MALLTAVTETVATALLRRPSLATKVTTYTPTTSVFRVGASVVLLVKNEPDTVLPVGLEVSVQT